MEARKFTSAQCWLVAGAALIHLAYLSTLVAHFFVPPQHRFPVDRLFRDSAFALGPGCDFYQFYQAGADVLAGRNFLRTDAAHRDVVPYSYPWVRYPPILAFTLGVATNLVPPRVAYAFWCVLLEACLVLCAVLLCRRFRAPADRSLVAAVFLAWSPYYTELYMGQTSLVLGTLVLVVALAHERGDRRTEGIAYVASVLFKYQTLVLGWFYLRLRRYRLLVVTGVLLVLTNAPVFLIHPGAWKTFTDWTVSFTDTRHIGYVGNFGFPAFLAHLTGDYSMELYRGAGLLVLVLSTLWTLGTRQLDPVRTMLLWILTPFFVMLTSWEHGYNVLLPLLMLAYLRDRQRELLVGLVLLALPTPFGLLTALYPRMVPGPAVLLMIGFKVVPLLLIYTSLLVRGVGPQTARQVPA